MMIYILGGERAEVVKENVAAPDDMTMERIFIEVSEIQDTASEAVGLWVAEREGLLRLPRGNTATSKLVPPDAG